MARKKRYEHMGGRRGGRDPLMDLFAWIIEHIVGILTAAVAVPVLIALGEKFGVGHQVRGIIKNLIL